MTYRKLVLALAVVLSAAGCESQNTQQNYGLFLSRAYQDGKLDRNQDANEQARRVFDRLKTVTLALYPEAQGWDWRVNVPNYPEANVYGWRRANLVLYEGFFTKLSPSDDEVAMAIAHELAHVVLRHHEASDKLRASSASEVAIAHAARAMEFEADKFGAELAVAAGYKADAMASLMKKMVVANPHPFGPYATSYPTWEARIENVREAVR
jgi:Zn-dependent protease with chaperone function